MRRVPHPFRFHPPAQARTLLVAEAAALAEVDVGTFYRLMSGGLVPWTVVHGRVRVPPGAWIERVRDAARTPPAAPAPTDTTSRPLHEPM
jgi:hypothetical protein